MQCTHHQNMNDKRDQHRAAHRKWVKSAGNGKASVLIGSATVDAAGSSTGNFGILKANTQADAQAFADNDPFTKNGIVKSITITPLPENFQAHRITDPMSKI